MSDKGDYEWVPYCSASEAYKIKQFTYEDARVQGWIDCLGAGEMVQSLHRIRPLLDPNKKIYVLSNKPLKSLNPTRLVELRRLEDELGIKEDPETRIRDWIEESLHGVRCPGKTYSNTLERRTRRTPWISICVTPLWNLD